MKEQDYTYDSFQFQSRLIKKKFSFHEKLIAIILVVIFMLIPLYEISSDAFKVNYVYKPGSTICASSYFVENPNIETEYIQGIQKVE